MGEERPSVRAIVAGFVLAVGLCAMNSYLTLSFGVIEEGPTIAALFFFAVFALARSRVTTTEVVLVATMGSAGGSLGFITNFYAARAMVGAPFSWQEGAAFAAVTSLLGLFFVVPLRDLLVLRESLPWPGSAATKAVITALVEGRDPRQGRMLAAGSLGFIGLVLANDDSGFGWIPAETSLAFLATGAAVAWSPFAIGGAYLMGFSTAVGFLVGGLVLLVMAPYTPDPSRPQAFVWPGIGFLLASGLVGLALNGRVVWDSLRSLTRLGGTSSAPVDDDPMISGRGLLLLGAVALLVTGLFSGLVLGMNVVAILILVVLGGFLQNLIATRAAAQTAFNPARVMGVLLEGATAATGMSAAPLNLVGAGFVAGSGAQAGNLCGDLAYGRWLGVPSRWQFWAQALTVLPCSLVSALVFQQIQAVDPITLDGGGPPAPVARIWATTSLLFDGSTPMPAGAGSALLVGALVGALYTLLEQVPALEGKLPAGVGIGLGLILPFSFDASFFLGGVLLWGVGRRLLGVSDLTLTTVAVAAIVGEGLGGVLKPILALLGVLG